MNKRHFYCWYLGFTEVNGLIGQQYVIDGLQKLTTQSNLFTKNQVFDIRRRRVASKVTISLNDTSFTLNGNTTANNNKNPISNVEQLSKSYTIDYEKISYITRLNDQKYADIVCLIIVNTDDHQNMEEIYQKQRKQHPYRHIANLHAFKFDSVDSAKRLEKYLNEFYLNYRQNVQKVVPNVHYNKNINMKNIRANSNNSSSHNVNININNRNNAAITVSNKSLNSGGGTNTASSSNDSEYGQFVDPSIRNNIKNISNEVINRLRKASTSDQISQINPVSPRNAIQAPMPFDDINNEFKRKLFSEQPLLLPPKDYNTVMRSRGDLEKAELRRSLNQHIVGKTAVELRSNQALEKIDENQQVNVTPTPRGEFKSKIDKTEDDDMSIDEEAKRVLNYYDAIVNSISMQTPVNNLNTSFTSSNHYRFEPPTNSNNGQLTKIKKINNEIKPTSTQANFNLGNSENLKMNPLHIVDEEYPNNSNSNYNKLLNHFKMQSLSSSSPSNVPSMAFQGGFRSNALTKLGSYAPKVLPKPPGYQSTENLQQNYYINNNNNFNNLKNQKQSSNQFSSSLPAEEFKKLIPSNRTAFIAPTYEEPEIDYYNTDTLDLHRNSSNRVKDSQFILKSNQNQQQAPLFTKLNNSTPNLIYEQYYNRQQVPMILERYADVYY